MKQVRCPPSPVGAIRASGRHFGANDPPMTTIANGHRDTDTASTVRSLLFALYQIVLTPMYAIAVLLLFWLPPLARFRFIIGWCRLCLWGARWICGIRHRIIGGENLPTGANLQPHIVMS